MHYFFTMFFWFYIKLEKFELKPTFQTFTSNHFLFSCLTKMISVSFPNVERNVFLASAGVLANTFLIFLSSFTFISAIKHFSPHRNLNHYLDAITILCTNSKNMNSNFLLIFFSEFSREYRFFKRTTSIWLFPLLELFRQVLFFSLVANGN